MYLLLREKKDSERGMKVAVIDGDVAGWTVGFFKFRRECYDSKK
jgi:hypothetical protein